MKKQELIAKRLAEPILVGDEVTIKFDYLEIETSKVKVGRKYQEVKKELSKTFSLDLCKVIAVEEDWIIIKKDHSLRVPDYDKFLRIGYEDVYKAHKSIVSHSIFYIGANPFVEKPWNSGIDFRGCDMTSLFYYLGWDTRKRTYSTEMYGKVEIPRINWNPIVGDNIPIQRDFIWTLEEKQLLIESIYNNIDIGKFVFRYRPYEYIIKELNKGNINLGERDIIDGKQRSKAILDFVSNMFPDLHGNYYDDLSVYAKHKFNSFRSMAIGELRENTTDEDVLAVFLGINFTGIPMSQEHIDYIKSIKL